MLRGKLVIGDSVMYGELDYPVVVGQELFYFGTINQDYGTQDFLIEGGPIITLEWYGVQRAGWSFEEDDR